MQLSARQLLDQFAHLLQEELFPVLEEAAGSLSEDLKLLASVVCLAPLERVLSMRRAGTGRPAKDRMALATAFVAKSILNLATTRALISRLRVDEALRRFCGWRSVESLPHEAKFSRAFAEFAAGELPQQLHAAVIEATQRERLIGHIARDATAIEVRERFPGFRQKKKKQEKRKQGRKGRKYRVQRLRASERGTRMERQRRQTLERMLRELPRQCDIGAKKSNSGHQQYWRGYKLHLDVADGQVPVSAILTSASVHDSQAAIPLMTMTSRRVVHLYELMDSAYDAAAIREHSHGLDHVPIIAPHGRRRKKSTKVSAQLSWTEQERFQERTMIERVNARLKDEFGARHIRVRGAAKVMAHLMFGVLALTVDQWLRLQSSA